MSNCYGKSTEDDDHISHNFHFPGFFSLSWYENVLAPTDICIFPCGVGVGLSQMYFSLHGPKKWNNIYRKPFWIKLLFRNASSHILDGIIIFQTWEDHEVPCMFIFSANNNGSTIEEAKLHKNYFMHADKLFRLLHLLHHPRNKQSVWFNCLLTLLCSYVMTKSSFRGFSSTQNEENE